eukprot:gene5894-biopygen2803
MPEVADIFRRIDRHADVKAGDVGSGEEGVRYDRRGFVKASASTVSKSVNHTLVASIAFDVALLVLVLYGVEAVPLYIDNVRQPHQRRPSVLRSDIHDADTACVKL